MKVLILCDDFWHPGEVIVKGLKPLEKKGYELDFVMHCRDILTKEMIREYDVIVNARGNFNPVHKEIWFDEKMADVMPKDFQAYIEEGHGFIALHAGNCFSRERQLDMAMITGNDFVNHPPQCDITMEMVGEHPITQNVCDFVVRDEHYRIDVHAKDIQVFMRSTSDSEAKTQIAGYTREMGKGRFCCLTPGHKCAVLWHSEFQKLIENALKWCVHEI